MHCVVLKVHKLVQARFPPVKFNVWHVCPLRFDGGPGSHCSPGLIAPLPQVTGCAQLIVIGEFVSKVSLPEPMLIP